MSNKLQTAIGYALAELSRAYYAAEATGDFQTQKSTAIAYANLSRESGYVTPHVTRPTDAGYSVPPKH
jgi:hypothetical protein